MKNVNDMVETNDLTPLLAYYECTEDKIPWDAVSLYCNFRLTPEFKTQYKDKIVDSLLNKYQPPKVKKSKKATNCIFKVSTDEYGEKYLTVSLKGNYHLYLPEGIDLDDVNDDLVDTLLSDTDLNSFGECVYENLTINNVLKK